MKIKDQTWAPAEGDTGTHTFWAVTYAAGKFVAVGDGGTILISEDGGVTWAKAENTGTHTFIAVTYAADKFVAVGDGGTILISEDGKHCTKVEKAQDFSQDFMGAPMPMDH